MNKNCAIATVVGGIVLYLLGFLVYGLLLRDFFANEVVVAEPIMWALIVAQFVSAGLLALVLSWKGVGNAQDGFKAGAQVGLLVALAMSLSMFSMTENMYTITTVIGDAIASAVLYGITGAVVATLLNRAGATEG